MTAFKSLLLINIKRRSTDGFAVGYNIFFPLLIIWLLGMMCKGLFLQEEITAYQYYGVVFIPFCICLSVITAAYGGKDDAYANTAERVLLSPVSVTSIVLAKVIAETIVFAGCSLLVLAVCFSLWKVWSIQQILPVGVMYLSLSFLTASVGTFVGLGMKDFMKIKNILNIPVAIFALLAGCFFRIGTFHKGLQFLIDLSPLTWVNRSIFMMMYDESSKLLYLLCGIFFLCGVLFTLLAIKTFKKEEYGNGELPGYEK